MEVKLLRACAQDAEEIWKMQVEAFAQLLYKYQDYDTSPANETVDRVRYKLELNHTYFYFIEADGQTVGAIRVIDFHDTTTRKRISPLFILPAYQNRGIAQTAIAKAEELHGSSFWGLDTILQEKGNCHLYEKMGYHLTGKTKAINDKMTLVFYEKD